MTPEQQEAFSRVLSAMFSSAAGGPMAAAVRGAVNHAHQHTHTTVPPPSGAQGPSASDTTESGNTAAVPNAAQPQVNSIHRTVPATAHVRGSRAHDHNPAALPNTPPAPPPANLGPGGPTTWYQNNTSSIPPGPNTWMPPGPGPRRTAMRPPPAPPGAEGNPYRNAGPNAQHQQQQQQPNAQQRSASFSSTHHSTQSGSNNPNAGQHATGPSFLHQGQTTSGLGAPNIFATGPPPNADQGTTPPSFPHAQGTQQPGGGVGNDGEGANPGGDWGRAHISFSSNVSGLPPGMDQASAAAIQAAVTAATEAAGAAFGTGAQQANSPNGQANNPRRPGECTIS